MPNHASSAAQSSGAGGVPQQIAQRTSDTGTLFLQQRERSEMKPAPRTRSSKQRAIDPVLKSWIDRVIVPALVDKWNEQHKTIEAPL